MIAYSWNPIPVSDTPCIWLKTRGVTSYNAENFWRKNHYIDTMGVAALLFEAFMRRPNLRVAPYPHSKTSPWCIEGLRVDGKRKRLFFQTKTAAEQELVRIKTNKNAKGPLR